MTSADRIPANQSPLPAVNHLTLFDMFKAAWDLQMKVGKVPESNIPVFAKAYPQERTGQFDKNFEVIVFHLVGSEMAGTDKTGEQRVPKAPWRVNRSPHPEKHGYQEVDATWWEWVTVQFTIYSKTAEKADELAYWFHRFMMFYGRSLQFFRQRGVEEMSFLRRLEDRKAQEYGQELFIRPLQYRVRLSLTDRADAKLLDEIGVAISGDPAFTLTKMDGY